MTERTPANRDEALLCFGDLAGAFRVLIAYSKAWTDNAIISVLDEITSEYYLTIVLALYCNVAIIADCPEEWLTENLAHLLFLCGDRLTSQVLCSKAINGRIVELCDLVPALSLVYIQEFCNSH
jgi:F-box protein 47